MRPVRFPRRALATTVAAGLGLSLTLTGLPAHAATPDPTPAPTPTASASAPATVSATPSATPTTPASTATPTASGSTPATPAATPSVSTTPAVRNGKAMDTYAIPPVTQKLSGTSTTSATGTVTLAALPAQETEPFTMVGVTWTGDVTPTVQVKTRSGSTWSAWTTLERDSYRGAGNAGTDPVFLGTGLTGVEVRVSGAPGLVVKDLRLTLINSDAIAPGEAADPTLKPTRTEQSSLPTEPGTARPLAVTGYNADATAVSTRQPGRPAGIITRAQWGANEALADHACLETMPTIQGAIIHHTAGSNTYTADQSAGIMRGILSFHTQTRGWCDVGYNILVDKYGQIFEGRYGSLDRAVQGVHAANGNYRSVGISMMMNSDSYAPGTAVYDKVARLVAWRLGTYNTSPTGTAKYLLNGVWTNRGAVAGHKEVSATACPGANIWANMSQIRSKANAMVTVYRMVFKGLPTQPAVGAPVTITGTVPASLNGKVVTVTFAQDSTVLGTATTTVTPTGTYSVTSAIGSRTGGAQTVSVAIQPVGAPVLKATQTITRVGTIEVNALPAQVPLGYAPTLYGRTDAAPGSTITITGTLNGTSAGTVATTTVRPDGTWFVHVPWQSGTAGTVTYRATTGTIASETLTTVRSATAAGIVMDQQATVLPGGTDLVVTGRIYPAAAVPLDVWVGAGVKDPYSRNGSVTTNADGTFRYTTPWSATYTGLMAVQVKGNGSASAVSFFERANRLAITSPKAGAVDNKTTSFTVAGTLLPATAGTTVTIDAVSPTGVAIPGIATATTSAAGTWSTTIDDPRLWGGKIQLRATATRGSVVTTAYQVLDRTPTLTWFSVPAQVYADTPLVFRGTSAYPQAGRSVRINVYTLDGTIIAEAARGTTRADGTYELSTTFRASEPGQYRYEAVVRYAEDGKDRFFPTRPIMGRDKKPTVTHYSTTVAMDATGYLRGRLNPSPGAGARTLVVDAIFNGRTYLAWTRGASATDGTFDIAPRPTTAGDWQFRVREESVWSATSAWVPMKRG